MCICKILNTFFLFLKRFFRLSLNENQLFLGFLLHFFHLVPVYLGILGFLHIYFMATATWFVKFICFVSMYIFYSLIQWPLIYHKIIDWFLSSLWFTTFIFLSPCSEEDIWFLVSRLIFTRVFRFCPLFSQMLADIVQEWKFCRIWFHLPLWSQ